MYMELVRHNVAYCNMQYFCYICRTAMSSSEDAWKHIHEKTHWEREVKEKFHISKTMSKKKKTLLEKMSKHNAKIVTSYTYSCVVCQENIFDVMSILLHIQSLCHKENLKSPKNDDCIAAVNNMKTEQKRKIEEVDIKPLLDTCPDNKENSIGFYKCIYFELFKRLHGHSDDIFKIFVDNGIIIFESYDIKCPLCSCLSNFNLALQHMRGHRRQEFEERVVLKERARSERLSNIDSEGDILSSLLFNFEQEQCTKLNENVMPDTNEGIENKVKEIDLTETPLEEDTIVPVLDSKKQVRRKFKCVFCNTPGCYYKCSEVFCQKLVENEIAVTNLGRFKCKLCKRRRIKGVPDILNHIKSMPHKKLKSKKFKESLNKELVIDCPNVKMMVNVNQTISLNSNACNVSTDVVTSTINTDEAASIEPNIKREKNDEVLNTNEADTAVRNNIQACSKNKSSGADVTTITKGINKISINNESNSIGSLITKDIKQQMTKLLYLPVYKQSPKEENSKKTLFEELNRPYTLKYLEIEEAMYNVREQLNDIQKNLKFIVPYNAYTQNLYCLLCNNPVSKEFATLYEHVCLEDHKMLVNEMTKDSESEKLLQQYMKGNENVVKCFACNVPNIINSGKHIKTNNHKINHEKFAKVADEIFIYVSQSLCDLWYSIQRFGCALCKASFKYKMDFLQHIVEKHSNISLKYEMFDFCIPCTTLWIADKNSYAEHCRGKIHKYLVKNQDFMIGNLPKNIENILQDVDYVSDTLIQDMQTLLNNNIQDEIIESLESSLRTVFPKVKAYVFGSRVAGLATVNSDIDIYVDCGNMYNEDRDVSVRKDYLTSIKKILKGRGEWRIKEMLARTRIPLIKLIHKKTGLNCDISTTNGLSVEKTKLLRSLSDSYLPCRKLILFIKKWFYYFDLPSMYSITSYALTWLVMFYLQTESYLPSVASLLKEGKKEIGNTNRKPTIISGWEVDIAQPKNNNNNNFNQSTSTLLMGFFQFYANFDYQHNVICPLMGHPVPRKAFAELNSLPNEMGAYKWQLRMSKNPKYFRIDSPLCIQDPLDLTENMTKAASSITLNYFKQYCHKSAATLQLLPK